MNRNQRLATVVLLASLAQPGLAQEAKKKSAQPPLPATPDGVVIEQDVAYLPADRAEKADLYFPAKRDQGVRSPAVVIIHGGGWTSGDKAAIREFNIGTNLALNGYVGLSINYILA